MNRRSFVDLYVRTANLSLLVIVHLQIGLASDCKLLQLINMHLSVEKVRLFCLSHCSLLLWNLLHLNFWIQNELVFFNLNQMSSGLNCRLGQYFDKLVPWFLLVVIVTIHFFVELIKLDIGFRSFPSVLVSCVGTFQSILGLI